MTRTIDVNEVIWILAALPGLYFWIRNASIARKSVKLAVKLEITNGRLVWAKFSKLLTTLFISIELAYIAIGVNAMFRVQSAAPNQLSLWLTVIVLTGTSLAITYIAFKWKQVDDYLVESARKRKTDEAANGNKTA